MTCVYCGTDQPTGHWTREHIIPLGRGGENKRRNIVTACSRCNALRQRFLTVAEYVHFKHVHGFGSGINKSQNRHRLMEERREQILIKAEALVRKYLEENRTQITPLCEHI